MEGTFTALDDDDALTAGQADQPPTTTSRRGAPDPRPRTTARRLPPGRKPPARGRKAPAGPAQATPCAMARSEGQRPWPNPTAPSPLFPALAAPLPFSFFYTRCLTHSLLLLRSLTHSPPQFPALAAPRPPLSPQPHLNLTTAHFCFSGHLDIGECTVKYMNVIM